MIPRVYDSILRRHLAENRQMAFLDGPRQVGKTSTTTALADLYLNWDQPRDRVLLQQGYEAVEERLIGKIGLGKRPVIVIDEVHKNLKWKELLKGLFDGLEKKAKIVVTGSARMDTFRRGGESLMGRYFPYRMHPLSVAELLRTGVPSRGPGQPSPLAESDFSRLLAHGGYPEPYLHAKKSFTVRWNDIRREQILYKDLRGMSQIQDLAQMDHLERILSENSGNQLVYSKLATEVGVAIVTVQRWVKTLIMVHQGFLLRPYTKNVRRSLQKEPKWYRRDWSPVTDSGARFETLLACHLLKAVDAWTDLGYGAFELHYLRDREKREVDFLVTRDRKPWFLAEAKVSDATVSPALRYFHEVLKPEHSFQVVQNLPYIDADCFKETGPLAVPALTFLSQLV
jgi:predicted AAA+ superfamily ATPase